MIIENMPRETTLCRVSLILPLHPLVHPFVDSCEATVTARVATAERLNVDIRVTVIVVSLTDACAIDGPDLGEAQLLPCLAIIQTAKKLVICFVLIRNIDVTTVLSHAIVRHHVSAPMRAVRVVIKRVGQLCALRPEVEH